MNKVQKIREDVERLYKEEHSSASTVLHKVLDYIDSLPEEPVSGLDNGDMPVERWKQAVKAASNQRNYRRSKGHTETSDDYFVDGVQWADEHPKEEPVSEELDEAAFDYAESCKYEGGEKLLCVEHFKAGAQWQKEQMMKDAIEIEGGEIHLNYANAIISKGTAPFEKCKVKMIIIKEDKDE